MSMGFAFWLLMLLWLIFGFYRNRSGFATGQYFGLGSDLLLFVLFGLLGWHAFGAPIH